MARRLRHPLVLVLLAGLALRIALVLDYRPAFISYPDAGSYLEPANGDPFGIGLRPPGYPAFLAAADVLGDLGTMVVLQHLLGLATAVLAYLMARRLGLPRVAASVPALVVAVSVDQLLTEHGVLSEGVFTFVLVAGCTALAVAATRDGVHPLWAGAGALLALAVWVRTAGVAALPVAGLVALLAPAAAFRERLLRASALTVPAVVILLAFAALHQNATGVFGFSAMGDWSAYARAATFADCRVFEPPPGTEPLCEQIDVRERPNGSFYAWSPQSPGWKLVGHGPPDGGEPLGRFARDVMWSQPRAYATEIVRDLWRYVNPSYSRRPGQDIGTEGLPIDLRYESAEEYAQPRIEALYGERADVRTGWFTDFLASVQGATRLSGAWLLLALALSVVAVALSRGRERVAVAGLFGIALALLVFPVVTVVFNLRYAIPVTPLLAVTATAGAWLLYLRRPWGRRGIQMVDSTTPRPRASP